MNVIAQSGAIARNAGRLLRRIWIRIQIVPPMSIKASAVGGLRTAKLSAKGRPPLAIQRTRKRTEVAAHRPRKAKNHARAVCSPRETDQPLHKPKGANKKGKN